MQLAAAGAEGVAFDLGAGSDKLTLSAGGNTGSVTNIETLVGASGADTMTIIAAISSGSIDSAGGNDAVVDAYERIYREAVR